MRIISGRAGGIRLKVPKRVARPSTDRLREALFSILGPWVDDVRVLDLFSGSGALGIEALSRGAFIKDNKVFYDYNYYHGVHYQLKSEKLGEGEVHILFKFVEDGGSTEGIPGGFAELFINGKKVDEVKMPEMHVSTFSLSETFDVGIDAGTAVTTEYPVDTHFPYTGKLDKVTIRLTD